MRIKEIAFDLVVEKKVIIELKAIEKISDIERAQLLKGYRAKSWVIDQSWWKIFRVRMDYSFKTIIGPIRAICG